jgi:hypothetical protein
VGITSEEEKRRRRGGGIFAMADYNCLIKPVKQTASDIILLYAT